MEKSLQDLVDNDEYSITDIKHNKDYSQFDITLSTDEVGLTESFMVLAFYMYGGIYATFSGKTPENIVVNYYNQNGDLIESANSSDLDS